MIGFRRCREFDISGKLKTLSALNPRRHQRGGFFCCTRADTGLDRDGVRRGIAATRVSREASGSEGAALTRRRIRWRNFRHVPTFFPSSNSRCWEELWNRRCTPLGQ